MNCPACQSEEHVVLATRPRDGMTRRTRQCAACGKRWATIEAPEEVIDQANAIREHFAALQTAIGGQG